MPVSASQQIKRILRGLQTKGKLYFYNTRQFPSTNSETGEVRVITLHSISEPIGYKKQKTIYETANRNRLVLFLRDLWYLENGWELPDNNEEWVEIRKTIPKLSEDNY